MPELLPVALPDLSRADEPVQVQARERHAAVTDKLSAGAPAADLGAAFGDLGMFLHAAEYFDAAKPAYRNAQALLPEDPRWPYYLAHLHRRNGETTSAIGAFTRAPELGPSELAPLVWLGRMYLDQGQPDQAAPLFARAQAVSPRAVAVLAGLGRTALARRDYSSAASLLEEALALEPSAASLHVPLAQAYRGLGQTDKAEDHVARWRNTEIVVPDPLMDRLRSTLESGASYEIRGGRAFDAGNWQEAVELFRAGLEKTPPGTPTERALRHRLGLALYLSGDPRGALDEFEQVVRLAPASGYDEPTARAHYGLGVIMASGGRADEAVEHLSNAVARDPKYVQARLVLGDALRGRGDVEASLSQYEGALQINPQAAEARFGYAMALVRLGRYVEARAWLEDAVRVQPDRPELAHALARVLAAAPDAAARDGERALRIAQELLRTSARTELGETMAMALAEIGDYNGAAAIQRDVMDAAQRANLPDDVRRMARNLERYESWRPCRTPWPDDDPVHRPGPPVSRELAQMIDRR